MTASRRQATGKGRLTTFKFMCNVSVMNKRLLISLALLSAATLVGILRLAVWDTSNFGAFVILALGAPGTIMLANYLHDRAELAAERSSADRGTME